MSARSLTLAVRDYLCRDKPPSGTYTYAGGYGLGLTKTRDCDVTFDGRPHPGCGKLFFAVHHGRRQNNLLTGDESSFGVNVTISARANEPFDRIGTHLIDWADGVMAWANRVWSCIFANQWGSSPLGVMNLANTYLPGWSTSDTYGWTEALYPVLINEAQPVRADWFSASEEQPQNRARIPSSGTMPYAGLAVTVQFVGAKRLQRLDDLGA